MNIRKLVIILIGVVLIAFGLGIYSIRVNEQFKFMSNDSKDFININSKDSTVRIGSHGIEVIDGDDHVSIGLDGIKVNDGNDKVSIGWNGINVPGVNSSNFRINPGKWFNFRSSKMIHSNINEERFIDIDSIDEIAVLSSFIDIKVTSEDRDDVRIKYYGEMNSNVIPELKINKISSTIQIKLETPKANDHVISNSNIALEVFIPKSFEDDFVFSNSSGNIYMKDLIGKEIHATASSGKIISEDIQASSLLSTSSGNIQVEDFSGAFKASSSSGNISLSPEETMNNIKLSTSSGNVKINLPDDANYKIKGSSSSGIYTPSKNMIVEENSNGSFKATIGTGENTIDIRTSSGKVIFSE